MSLLILHFHHIPTLPVSFSHSCDLTSQQYKWIYTKNCLCRDTKCHSLFPISSSVPLSAKLSLLFLFFRISTSPVRLSCEGVGVRYTMLYHQIANNSWHNFPKEIFTLIVYAYSVGAAQHTVVHIGQLHNLHAKNLMQLSYRNEVSSFCKILYE